MQPRRKGSPDFLLLILTLLLVGFGLVMVFSASSAIALTDARFNNDALYFTKKQAVWIGLGIFVMLVVMNIPYASFKKLIFPIFFITIVALILVLFFGDVRNGARSWFGIGSFGIQPSELAKISIILYLGALIAKKKDNIRDFKRGLLPIIIIVGLVAGLIMLQPDLGSCLILLSCTAVMVWAGGANLKHLTVITLLGASVVILVVGITYLSDPEGFVSNYRYERFTAFMDPLADELDTGFQLINSLRAFGHGGFFGAGFGHGIQKLHYLPEPHNDFIFATIGEEFGFLGSFMFILIYLTFIWRGLIVSMRCPDLYGSLVGTGIMSLFAIQGIVNIGGVTGSMPITGVTLPFISYGGSSLLITMFSMGIVLSISRDALSPGQVSKQRDK
ncbi:stage V sporulation protein E [Paenibacillus swuensis]|uniref:Probable peptidoglycan glycosyltransferase FtsW n=1 Tax=Paenibacillus swuensis TaxID=1178515 RepID=A0A172TL00_9BACL|nr:putative lipid II flippase FtsW [Paenibacillus swuensis]ANE47453.1 stage V sporulation protein E [Paenibacillus swuensis]